MDKKSPAERQAEALEALVVEVAQVRVLLERSLVIREKRKIETAKKVPIFNEFLTQYKGLKFENEPFQKMYTIFENWCREHGKQPISKNRFSRAVHRLGYISEARSIDGKTNRVFVKV